MIQIVWEVIVKQDVQGQFELVYGPGGAWSKLFGKSPGFRGTTLIQDTHDPRRYLIFDIWDTETQQEQALSDRADDYAKLQADLEDWAELRRQIGVFRMRAEATVRARMPSRKSRRTPR